MSDPGRVWSALVVLAAVVLVVLPTVLVMTARPASASGSCQWILGGRAYCTQSLTLHHWCPSGTPCPDYWQTTVLLGDTFRFFPIVDRNGTAMLSVSVSEPNFTNYSFTLWAAPFGAPVGWIAPDGSALVNWPSPPVAWAAHLPNTTTVICGVAAST